MEGSSGRGRMDSIEKDATEEVDEVKKYHKDDYPKVVFLALTDFRDSLTLTDLTLNTEDGRSICVHSTVLAAVSSLIWVKLNERKVKNFRVNERKPADTRAGSQGWSLNLDPEVDCVGLEAVVEFAYTGLMSSLNEQNVDQIQAAARALGAPRMLALCDLHEEKPTKPARDNKRETLSAAEQMTINLESIKQMWMGRVGCDVRLEAPGGSVLGKYSTSLQGSLSFELSM
uniref:BTB domain-containing protein n=1 Tax=Fundulus heteroclitus TaxID=8078 RepID=A0A3Q2P2B2_FUNHE